MSIKIFEKIDRTNFFVGLGVWLAALGVYLKTMSPTLSFWDCGEFIAVSAILGIPHPPGAPLYVMIGRIFSTIPIFDDISARINLLSAVSSSLAALFCYLIGVRVIRHWFVNRLDRFESFVLYGGCAAGALLAAFGITNWNNSVEAEVYGLSMMLFAAIIWLALIYLDNNESSFSQRVMLLSIYLAFLGISVHMTTFLVMPIVALVFIMKRETPAFIWFVLASFVLFELYLIFALSSRPDEVPYYVPILIVLVLYMFFIFSFEQIRTLYLAAAGGLVLSIAPLFGAIYKTFLTASGNSSDLSASTIELLNRLGQWSFIATIIFAIYLIFKYLGYKHDRQSYSYYLHTAAFILAAGVMTAILLIDQLKGYKSFLFISVILVGVLAIVIYKYINWSILIASSGLLLIAIGVMPFVYGLLAAAVLLVVAGLVFKLPHWRAALLMIIAAVLGISSHVFIPIRSAHHPAINENNPSTSLQATINYLERKQYGSQSMTKRMFARRSEWLNQFGNHPRMGFWKFFSEQFAVKGPAFVIPLLIGIFGIWEIIRRGPPRGVILLLLLVISSVGLVLYMNFSDGTRQNAVSGADYLEVRDRDYFFTPAFILFGLCIGMGVTAVILYAKESLKNANAMLRKAVVAIACLLLLMPVITLAENYHFCDRTDNYVAYDYGSALLTSADENAVLFTNGDNDTFPLWCLQQAYGIRTDVDIVNLSLANTDWYIKQLAPSMGIKFTLTDEEVNKLRPFRMQDGAVTRIHHQVTSRIIDENFRDRPINFSVTVSSDSRRYRGQSIDSLLSIKGFSWRLNGKVRNMGVDVEEGYEFFMNPEKFKCRGANDPDVYLDESSDRLARNLANGFSVVADTLRKAGDFERAEKVLMKSRTLIPRATDNLQLLAKVYLDQKDTERLKILVDTSQVDNKESLLLILGQAYRRKGEVAEAEIVLNEALNQNPGFKPAFDELMRLHIQQKQYQSVRSGIMRWLQFNPNDQEMRAMYQELEKTIEQIDSSKQK